MLHIFNETLIELYETLIELYETLIELYETLIELSTRIFKEDIMLDSLKYL